MERVYWKDGAFRYKGSLETFGLAPDYLGPHDGGYIVSEELWCSLLEAQADGYEIVENEVGRPVPRQAQPNYKIVIGISAATGAPENIVRMALERTGFLARVAELQRTADLLNNTNQWEQAITHNLPGEEIPPTLPTQGVRRDANEGK